MNHFKHLFFSGILYSLVLFNSCIAGGEGADCGLFDGSCDWEELPSCSEQREEYGTIMQHLTSIDFLAHEEYIDSLVTVDLSTQGFAKDYATSIHYDIIYDFTLTNEFYVSTKRKLYELFNPDDGPNQPIDTLSCIRIDSVAPNGLLTTEEDDLLIWENSDVRIELAWEDLEHYWGDCSLVLSLKTITLSTGGIKENLLFPCNLRDCTYTSEGLRICED